MHDRCQIHISLSNLQCKYVRLLACTIDTKQAKCCHSCNGNINIMLIPWLRFRIRSQRLSHSERCHRHIVSHICKHEDNPSIYRRYQGGYIFLWQSEVKWSTAKFLIRYKRTCFISHQYMARRNQYNPSSFQAQPLQLRPSPSAERWMVPGHLGVWNSLRDTRYALFLTASSRLSPRRRSTALTNESDSDVEVWKPGRIRLALPSQIR